MDPDREKIYARVGTTVGGKYTLLRVLGIGGMGAVFEAENSFTERHVAIKLVLPELTRNKDVASRFLREARAASKVAHPNIVDVLDAGQDDDGSLFIVQELLTGTDLRHLLERRKTLSPEHALEIIAPIASALIAAHRRGVIHRDLKPENLFLAQGPSGGVIPKLLDFGIAKITQSSGNDTSLTRTGSGAMGTCQYMSPEQARGNVALDAQTDVWSLGVVLFEMLAGRCPFEPDDDAPNPYNAIMAQILVDEMPRLDVIAPMVPRQLADVIERALERDRTIRYANVQAFLGALLECSSLRGEKWHDSLRISHQAAVDATDTVSTPALPKKVSEFGEGPGTFGTPKNGEFDHEAETSVVHDANTFAAMTTFGFAERGLARTTMRPVAIAPAAWWGMAAFGLVAMLVSSITAGHHGSPAAASPIRETPSVAAPVVVIPLTAAPSVAPSVAPAPPASTNPNPVTTVDAGRASGAGFSSLPPNPYYAAHNRQTHRAFPSPNR